MGKSKNSEFKKAAKDAKAVLKLYLDSMDEPDFYYYPAGKYHDCHGDNKSSVKGGLVTQYMATTGEDLKFLVKVWHYALDKALLGPIEFKPDAEGNPPSSKTVVNELRKAAGLLPV
ncbi:hypothetical protein E8E13_001018 [Curvularia kusanoi]|uniref:Uncharacterized protein n=1 Tax=Curvularia kusanoi TaxID=90978 RepID=A0A9P4W216_CURKU|nr:hypothetical protein E8E13_001018 [Curvularia kusanoi]